MPTRFDLHAHSTASDGTLSPTELMRRAHAAGVEVMALTDHDTLEGLGEAAAVAAAVGIGFVPGVEVSVTWQGGTVHIVGLRVDPANAVLREGSQRCASFATGVPRRSAGGCRRRASTGPSRVRARCRTDA